MHGPAILARSLNQLKDPDKLGNRWQYHPRSDHHSKVACWTILFDLLLTSRLLVQHAKAGSVVFGVNHEMRDFKTGRKKNLDLVICTPGSAKPSGGTTFASLVEQYRVDLSAEESDLLVKLPLMVEGQVGEVHVALEAKACMTEHKKARPRLYDELSSSHQTIHGSATNAVAAGFVMVNLSDEFISPERNKFRQGERPADVTKHKQPSVTESVIEKIKELPRRSNTTEVGFDALGLVVVSCRNDGSQFEVVDRSPAPPASDWLHYDNMIRRAAKLYESRFPQV